MDTQYWITGGVGSMFSGGALNFLQSIPITSTSSASFGVLPTVLVGLGIVFVGYGIVKDFFFDKLPNNQITVPPNNPSASRTN